MAIRTITVKGSEILSKNCKPIKDITDRIKVLAEDMIDTMLEANGVGLAAPQVGIMKRIFVARPYVDETYIDEEGNEVKSELDKFYVMINPEIVSEDGVQESTEGCLSVPGYMGLVERPEKIVVKYTDIEGNEIEEEFEGFPATVICHENDHLNGVLYCDKAIDFMSTEEYQERLNALEEARNAEDDAELTIENGEE